MSRLKNIGKILIVGPILIIGFLFLLNFIFVLEPPKGSGFPLLAIMILGLSLYFLGKRSTSHSENKKTAIDPFLRYHLARSNTTFSGEIGDIDNWYVWIIIISILMAIYFNFFDNKVNSKSYFSEEELYHESYRYEPPDEIYAP